MLRSIPFGRLNRREAGAGATGLPDGTLTRAENVRPVLADPDGHGPEPPALEYEPVGRPERVLDHVSGVLWAGVHTRTRSELTDSVAGHPARLTLRFPQAGEIGGSQAVGTLAVSAAVTDPDPELIQIQFAGASIEYLAPGPAIDHGAIAAALNAQPAFAANWTATAGDGGGHVIFTSKARLDAWNGFSASVIAERFEGLAVPTSGGTDADEPGLDETLSVAVGPAVLGSFDVSMAGLQAGTSTRNALLAQLEATSAITDAFTVAATTSIGLPAIRLVSRAAGVAPAPIVSFSEANGFEWVHADAQAGVAGSAAQARRRLVAITSTHLRVYDFDPASPSYGVLLVSHLLGQTDPTRTGSLANLGAACLVATRTGAGAGPVFFVGDEIAELRGVPFPRAAITGHTLLDDGEPGLAPGTYLVRAALIMADGTIGPAGPVLGHIVTPHTSGGTIEPTRAFSVSVELDGSGIPEFWRRRSRGVAAVVAHVALQVDESTTVAADKLYGRVVDGIGGPYHRLVSATWDELASGPVTRTAKPTTAALMGADLVSDDNLAYLGAYARTVAALNGRAILGGAAWHYPLPDYPIAPGDEERRARIGVEIETVGGTITRIGPPQPADAGTITVGIAHTAPWAVSAGTAQGVVRRPTYPDRRAKKLILYVETATAGVWARARELPLEAPATGNVAFGTRQVAVGALSGTEPTLAEADIDRLNAELDDSPRRLAATEPFSAFRLPAARVTYAGDSDADSIERVLPMGLAPSEGQFGAFDLLVLSRASMRLLRTHDAQGGPLFGSVSVLAVGRGVTGPLGAASIGSLAVAASHDGLRVLDPWPETVPLSAPMHDETVIEALAAGVALGWRQADDGDELWVAPRAGPLVGRVLAYSFSAGAWFEMVLDRRAWFAVEDADSGTSAPGGLVLYGIDSAGRIWREEAAPEAESVSVVIETAPLALGLPNLPKALRQVRLGQRPPLETATLRVLERVLDADDDLEPVDELLAESAPVARVDYPVLGVRARSVRQPRIRVVGEGLPGQRLLGVDVRYEPRRALRLRPGETLVEGEVTVVPNPAPPAPPASAPPAYPN